MPPKPKAPATDAAGAQTPASAPGARRSATSGADPAAPATPRKSAAKTRAAGGTSGVESSTSTPARRPSTSKAKKATAQAAGHEAATEATSPSETTEGKRSNRTFYLPDELYVRGRNAVAWTSLVPGEAGSYAALTERALRAEVERLETTFNNGEPFEDAQLKRGPAAGVMERVHALRAKARTVQQGEDT